MTKEPGNNTRISAYPSVLCDYFIRYPYAPFLSQVVVTRRCNLACAYCNEYDDSSDPVPTGRLYTTIDKLSHLKTRALTLTGGEPLLHPDFIEILTYACRKINRVSLVTNGFLITKNLIRKLNKTGLSRMQISVDGISPSKTTQKVLQNTESKLALLAKHASFKVHVNTVIGSIPFTETLEVVRFASNIGLETTVQWLHDERGRVLNPFGIGKSDIKNLAAECKLPFYHSEKIMRVGLTGHKAWKCRAGSRFLYIDEFSMAHLCSQTIPLWSCLVDELDVKILKRNFYLNKPCSSRCTIGCVRDSSKYDFFRRQDKAGTGEYDQIFIR